MEALRNWGGPVVDLSGILPDSPFPQIGIEPGSIGELGGEYFHQQGLERIVYVSGMDWTFEMDRWQGLRAYCHTHGLKAWWWVWSEERCMDSVNAEPLPALSESSRETRHPFLASVELPFALFTARDRMGSQLCDVCRSLGLRVPRDVAVLGVDNCLSFCESCTPPLSSIRLPGTQLGIEAATIMDKLLKGETAPAFTRLKPLDVFERDSTVR